MSKRPSEPESAASPGQVIRALRQQLGFTLGDVSARTGMSVPTLSKLEQGKASLSYDKLLALSKGLGVDMAQLLEPTAAPLAVPGRSAGRRIVQRAGEGQLVETKSYRQHYLATELLNKMFTPLVVEVRARTLDEFVAEFGGLIHHPGQEFCLVLEGEIEFHTEFYAPVRLGVGDSIYFDSDMGHAYLAAAPGTCRILGVCAGVGHGTPMLDEFIAVSNDSRPAAPAVPSVPLARGERSAPARTKRRGTGSA
jgi:transcriptional regulator with XRE-family HTH domain